MALTRFLLVLLGTTVPLLFFSLAEAGQVGVSYGRIANNLPKPASVVKLLKQNGITMVRLYDTNAEVLKALANTSIKVLVMLPNENLTEAATNQSYAQQWVRDNVKAYYPATQINGVAVGSEVFMWRPDLKWKLVPAMNNVQAALAQLGLATVVKVSTPIAFTALRDTFPPSSGRFRDEIAQSVMKPMLRFLQRTGSYLTMNPYPFFAYAEEPEKIPLDYALGNYKPGVVDKNTGLVYHSLLDTMMDATYYAIENLTKQLNIRQPSPAIGTQWTETGWPSGGQILHGKPPHSGGRSLEAGNGFQPATVANAKAYNNNLINRVLSGKTGTPHRPDADMDVYIFALFNENQKGAGADDIEQNFGLFYPNGTKVYEFDFNGAPRESWCVANASVGDARLQAALDYACGHGADCGAIQPGGKCFLLNTRVVHASYVFNSYYQRNHHAPGTCDFGGAAYVVYHAPKYPNCVLPSEDWIEETAAKSEGNAAI